MLGRNVKHAHQIENKTTDIQFQISRRKTHMSKWNLPAKGGHMEAQDGIYYQNMTT